MTVINRIVYLFAANSSHADIQCSTDEPPRTDFVSDKFSSVSSRVKFNPVAHPEQHFDRNYFSKLAFGAIK